ncbi:MAG: efflux transporter outer membrane subunit [Pseudomonadota bacterium]
MNGSIRNLVIGGTMLLALGGCAVGTPYQRPDVPMPAQWDQTAVTATATAGNISSVWWQQFGSAELDQLMVQALAANHDLAGAVIRIRQARATAGIVDAARLPSAGVSAGGSQSRGDQNGNTTSSQSSQVAVTVAYELDLWGGKGAASEAARASLDATVYDKEALALVLQAEVATNYFQALALKDRLVIAQKNLDAAHEVLRLVELRYKSGANTGLEVSQQRTAVLSLEAQIPQLQQDLRTTLTALAVLLGQAPQNFTIRGESLAGLRVPVIAPYQPAALLERRPDIRKAEAQLAAANANVSVARAALYPSVNLSLSAVAGGVLTSGSSFVTSLAASLAQSIFDGGRLRGQVELSQARKEEVVQQYLQSVLTGLKEVQDNLGATATTGARQVLLQQAAVEAQEAYRIANVKHEAGANDLLELLDSQRTRLSAEDNAIQAALARLNASAGLYKSLGGGWSGETRDRR